ncbi:MAG: hypothetical protein AAB692_00005, partial [Patescibacteria group bacterium]
ANGGGFEPSYDVLYDVSSSLNPMQIGWRLDAFPYVIMLGDEEAQTLLSRHPTEAMVAPQMSSCALPGCQSGDKIEIYLVISKLWYELQYDTIVYNELDRRIYEIRPADDDRYFSIFREIFADVCFPNTDDGGVSDGGSASQPDGGAGPSDAGMPGHG